MFITERLCVSSGFQAAQKWGSVRIVDVHTAPEKGGRRRPCVPRQLPGLVSGFISFLDLIARVDLAILFQEGVLPPPLLYL
jgi:hypothetical protein